MNTRWIVAIIVAAGCLAPLPAPAQTASPTLARIRQAGAITLGYRDASRPFSFLSRDQKPAGYSIDLCMRVVDAVRTALAMPTLAVRYVALNPHTRIPLLVSGAYDIECGSTTNTLARQQQVDFSYITYVAGTRLLVKAASGVHEFEDLNGKTLALALGTTNEPALRALIEANHLNVRVISVADHPEGMASVQTDRADAYATDDIALFGLIANARSPKDFAVVGRLLTYEPYGLMVGRNDSEFLRIVNATLADTFRGDIGTVYATWLTPLGAHMGDLLKAAFQMQSIPR